MSMNNYGFIFYKIMFINYDVIFRFKQRIQLVKNLLKYIQKIMNMMVNLDM